MLKLGITGGIGSGKSVVSRLFAQLGIPVFDSDKVAKILIDTDPEIRRELISVFGDDIYLPAGKGLDRKKVGSIVFQNKKALGTLNAITHPPVILAAKKWMDQQEKTYEAKKSEWLATKNQNRHTVIIPPALYVIKEAALLFESGTNKPLDFILGVYADRGTRVRRVIQRDGLSAEAVEARMAKQMDEEKKMNLCDGIIINDGQQLLWPQVLRWHRYFTERVFHEEGWHLEGNLLKV